MPARTAGTNILSDNGLWLSGLKSLKTRNNVVVLGLCAEPISTGRTSVTLVALRALLTVSTVLPISTGRTSVTLRTLRTFRPLRTFRSLRTFRPLRTFRSLRTFRPLRTLLASGQLAHQIKRLRGTPHIILGSSSHHRNRLRLSHKNHPNMSEAIAQPLYQFTQKSPTSLNQWGTFDQRLLSRAVRCNNLLRRNQCRTNNVASTGLNIVHLKVTLTERNSAAA